MNGLSGNCLRLRCCFSMWSIHRHLLKRIHRLMRILLLHFHQTAVHLADHRPCPRHRRSSFHAYRPCLPSFRGRPCHRPYRPYRLVADHLRRPSSFFPCHLPFVRRPCRPSVPHRRPSVHFSSSHIRLVVVLPSVLRPCHRPSVRRTAEIELQPAAAPAV